MVCYYLLMNDDVITDLKQFISATVSQATSQQTAELRKEMNQLEKKLERKIDDLTEFVTETFDATNEDIDTQLKNHEQRLTKLEHAKGWIKPNIFGGLGGSGRLQFRHRLQIGKTSRSCMNWAGLSELKRPSRYL